MKEPSFIRFKILSSDEKRLNPYRIGFWELYEKIAACTTYRGASVVIRYTGIGISLRNEHSTIVKPDGGRYPKIVVVQRGKRFLFFETTSKSKPLLELEITKHTTPGTHVIFYKEKDEIILAYFPKTAWDQRGTKACYSSNGQHSSCTPSYLRTLFKATAEEYMPLLAELQGIGYDDLLVLNFQ